MADLSMAQRESLKSKQFAIPQSKAKKIGVAGEIQGESKGKYPIPDMKHARNALARVSQKGTPAEREAVRKKVYSRFPGLREGFEERHGESPTSKENVKMKEQGGISKEAMAAFFDELEKISSRIRLLQEGAEKAIQAAGGRMTPQAQKLHQAAWRHQQAAKQALAPRLKAYQAAQGRVAKKPQQGLFSRIFGGGGAQPAMAGA